MFARRPKRTILRTSCWASWQAGLLSKRQQATEQKTVEHACQETKTDDSGDLLLGFIETISPVEKGAPQEDPSGTPHGSVMVKRLSVGAQTRALYTKKLGSEQKTNNYLQDLGFGIETDG